MWSLRTTPVAGDIVFHPGVEFKPVEGDALSTDGNACKKLPNLGIEAIAVHAEVERHITQSNTSRPDPWAVEPLDPAVAIERENQQPHGQPVPVARAVGIVGGALHQIPAQVLQLPLVGTDLPAPPDRPGNVSGPGEMLAHRAAP